LHGFVNTSKTTKEKLSLGNPANKVMYEVEANIFPRRRNVLTLEIISPQTPNPIIKATKINHKF
jgi:hypothetical protein